VGGDKENEASQERRYASSDREKYQQLQEWRERENSFWPRLDTFANPWTWAIIGLGVAGAVIERGLGGYFSEATGGSAGGSAGGHWIQVDGEFVNRRTWRIGS